MESRGGARRKQPRLYAVAGRGAFMRDRVSHYNDV